LIQAIFISKKKVTSGKIPARVLAKFSTIGSASHHRTWGTWSRKNLMRASVKCRNVRIGP